MEVGADENDVRSLNGDIGPSANSYPHISAGEGHSIVDAVAHHCHAVVDQAATTDAPTFSLPR